MSDTQIIHQLLSQLGIKLVMNWSRSHPGYAGEKLRVYSLDIAHWEQLWIILQRRQTKREALQRQRFEIDSPSGSPVEFKIESGTGDPTANTASSIDAWSAEEAIEDVTGLIDASGCAPAVITEIE